MLVTPAHAGVQAPKKYPTKGTEVRSHRDLGSPICRNHALSTKGVTASFEATFVIDLWRIIEGETIIGQRKFRVPYATPRKACP